MARRLVSVELELLARQYLREGEQVLSTTVAATRAVDDLGDKADAASRDMLGLAAGTEAAKRQVDDLGDKARGTAADLTLLQRRVDATKLSVKSLALEFARTGEAADFALLRKERAELSKLEQAQKILVPPSPPGGFTGNLLGSIPNLGGVSGPAVAAIGASVVALSPAIGATIAAAVLGGVGTGGLIGGIALAAQDTRVKAAWQQFYVGMTRDLGDAAVPLVDPLIAAIDRWGTQLKQDMPTFAEDFKILATTIAPVSDGIAGFVHNMGPGLTKAFKASIPLAEQFGKEFAGFGTSIGRMLDDLADAEPGAQKALHDLFLLTDSGVESLGRMTKALSGVYDLMRSLPTTDLAVQVGMQSTGLLDTIMQYGELFTGPETSVRNFGAASTAALSPTEKLNRALEEQAGAAAANEKALDQASKAVDQYYEAILAPLDAEERWEAAIDALTESVKNNGKTLDVHTEKGRANRDAIEEMASAAKHQLDVGQITEQQYLREIQSIETMAQKLGLSRDEVDKLIGKFKELPSKLFTDIILSINGRGNALDLYRQMMTSGVSLPPLSMGEHSGTHGAAATSTNPNSHQQLPGLASGGDALAGHMYWVGEEGPEPFVPATNGTVYPSGTALTVGGGTTTHVVDLRLNGRTIRTMVIDDAQARAVPQTTIELAYP